MSFVSRLLTGAQAAETMGHAAKGVAEVFVPNATRRMELDAEAQAAALGQHTTEFSAQRPGGFDRFVNGLNRLPRPMLALGTLGLFIYAMVEPAGFAMRMEGLAYVPEPLWWLLGAIVSFYFGARELHYSRTPKSDPAPAFHSRRISAWRPQDSNAALEDWRAEGAPRKGEVSHDPVK